LELSLILGFITATLALALMPGPDNIYVLTESISKGWRQGVSITSGLISGCLIHTTLVATGLSVFVFNYPSVYNILKFAGAAYLLYMAYGAFKEQPIALNLSDKQARDSFWPLFRKGFIMNVLNPKVTLFFIVLLPQFVSNDGFSPMWQMMILGLIFMAVSFPVFASVALLAGKAAAAIATPRFWEITKYVKIAVLVGLSILLALSER
jgi:threonine/homoserine/homoserine lactone efflux protein